MPKKDKIWLSHSGIEGMLVGSAVTMKRSEENLRQDLGLSAADAARLLSHNPRLAVGI